MTHTIRLFPPIEGAMCVAASLVHRGVLVGAGVARRAPAGAPGDFASTARR